MASELLPSAPAEFSGREYWDRFFIERGSEAFEWYGKFGDVRGQLEKLVKREEGVLIIGCGNSDFSAELYDCGYHSIRNLDFSELVINEMRAKNQMARPDMHWDVGDMTDMNAYGACQFDVVFDKGALDALMSVESAEVMGKAADMFREIERVLSLSGRYICVSLAEPFILKTLINGFASQSLTTRWSITIEGIVNGGKPSPYKALMFTFQRVDNSTQPSAVPLSLFVDQIGRSLDKPQLVSAAELLSKISSMQELYRKSFDLRDIKPDRFESFEVFAPEHPDIPRFTIAIVDADDSATLSCAVLFLPQGREAEYQFSTAAGLRDIACEAGYKRLLAVRCNRPHSFHSNPKKLQDELDLVVLALKPACCRPEDGENIPYMVVGADSSWDTVASGESSVSGRWVVEENAEEGPSGTPTNSLLRRLIFLCNQNFVQTELRLLARKAQSKPKPRKNSGGGKKGAAGGEVLEFDHTYLDAHHRTMLAGLTLSPRLVRAGMRGAVSSAAKPRASVLLVGLGGGALPMIMQRYLPELQLTVCDIDGELEAIAKEHFGFRATERCKVVVSDGLVLLAKLQKQIAGGINSTLEAVADAAATLTLFPGTETEPEPGLAPNSLDLLIIDVDSKDTSQAMSAPPRAFATRESLETMHSVLRPGGLLAINVAARSDASLQAFTAVLRSVFIEHSNDGGGGRVFSVRGSEDLVNVTVIAVRGEGPEASSVSSTPGGGKASKMPVVQPSREQLDAREMLARDALLGDWLRSAGLQGDPLELGSFLARLCQLRD